MNNRGLRNQGYERGTQDYGPAPQNFGPEPHNFGTEPHNFGPGPQQENVLNVDALLDGIGGALTKKIAHFPFEVEGTIYILLCGQLYRLCFEFEKAPCPRRS